MSKKVFLTSFGQQRLWFLDQVTPGTATYNLARALRLSGSLNQAALAKALQEIVSRHESLRTVFVAEGDQVGQVVSSAPPTFDLSLSDLSERPASQREQAALRIAGEEAGKPFDLSKGPLLRAKLFRLGPEEHILLFVIHHIIADGWSMNLLFYEMGEFYAGFATGSQPPLPKLNLQYADYAHWQRNFMTSDFLAGEIEYWKKKLDRAETSLRLPTDYPRPAAHSGRGKSIHFNLSQETNNSLKALAQSESATLFMVLLSAFQVLLARYALQNKILVGTPTAGRNDIELENLIGFFVNTLILRADLNPDGSFRQILRQTRANTLEALAHQDMPFEKLVEVMQPDRSQNRNPLFQVMFILQNAPKQKAELPGLVMEEIEFETGVAKFDLTLEVVDLGNLHCTFEYDADLYQESTIRRMAGHFAKLVETVVATPDEKLSRLSLLTAAEVQQLVEWNNTSSEYPRELCIHTAFEEQGTRTPDKTAVIDQKNRLSYRELNELANRLARCLIGKGVRPGGLVGISLSRSTEMVIALLGILKTGAAYVPLDPVYPEQRLEFMVEDSQVNLVVTTPEYSDLWQKHRIDALTFDTESLSASAEDACNLLLQLSAGNRMYVIYTSGSTGSPKGIEGTHRASMNRFSWMWEAYPFLEGEICCQKTSLGFVDSVWEIFGPLLRGVPSVILPDEAIINPEHLVQLLSQYRVTRIVLVPSLLRVILERVEELQNKLPKLWLWTCSGEALPLELVNRFAEQLPSATFLNIYGSAEVAADVTWHEITAGDQSGPVPIGRPISNVQIFLFDCDLNQVPVGVPGELYVGGDCLAQGYLGRPALTSERFIVHRFGAGSSVRLFRTGDLGCYLPNGEIRYLGRTDNQVKIRGVRVELGEIEAVLASQPKIRDAVVILADRSGQQRLTAYFEVRPGLHPDVDELRRFMKSSLPDPMVPSEYLVVNAFPLLPSGKVDRKTLALQTSAHPIGDRGYVAPQTATQERVAAIWRNLLKVGTVGITDNFFELGGHSLMVMQVVARIRKEFEVEVPVRSLFDDPTIQGLAIEVEEAKAKGIKPSAPISSFLQAQNTHDRSSLSVENLSREELEEMLRQVLSEKSLGSSN
ncbi:MAG: amino acid adenylation domain-containing protein [Acidobacteriaceae bacterium]